MKSLSRAAALIAASVAVVATSPGDEQHQSMDYSFDLVSRDRAVYAVRSVGPPEGKAANVSLRFQVSAGDSVFPPDAGPVARPDAGLAVLADVVMVKGAVRPTEALLERLRTERYRVGDQIPDLGEVLVDRTLEDDQVGWFPAVSFAQGEAPTYLTLLRRGGEPVLLQAVFAWSNDEGSFPGDLLVEDLTGTLE